MRLIELNEYNDSYMQLAKPVYDSKRRVLLGIGTKIHPKYLAKLKQLGIKYLFIEDITSKGISLEDMMEMPTWLDILAIVENAFKAVAANQLIPLLDIRKSVKKLIEEVIKRNAVMLIPTTAVESSLTPFAHAVNVTIIALQTGKKLGYNNSQLNDLGIGCMLHDIGKATTIKQEDHPENGFNILRAYREISLMSAHIAYQHHETLDGQGFPRQLSGDQVLEFAQICSIANDFDNFVSAGLLPHVALEKIMSLSEKKYEYHIVLAFSKGIISYPPGTNVQLKIGSGIVTRIDSNPHRPIVRIHRLNKEIDLGEQPTLLIESILKEEDLKNIGQ
ncbi:HD-GYP domain-containing protein [Alkalihalobacillus deserti]|uniref:HD-GYP domain-containing protein n=1 Tax=Alkalihalobacillus deserti TaxID=2879466 RepID=UPI001D136A29|nr:HD domain-containing phosphohydrolase [Alkalihalobacillus deserti]